MSPREAISAAITAERFRHARELVGEALVALSGAEHGMTVPPPADLGDDVLALQLRRADLCLTIGDEPADEALLQLESLLAQIEASTAEAPRALHEQLHLQVVRALGIKRLPELQQAALERAERLFGSTPELALARGRAALAFDDRETAEHALVAVHRAEPKLVAAWLALAELRYVLGAFDAAEELLVPIAAEDACWPAATRLRTAIAAAREDYASEAALWSALVAGRPQSDQAPSDRLALAHALAADGQYGAALSRFRELWLQDRLSPLGRHARDRMDHLERAMGRKARRQILPAFPSTQQKWNYCGPAVLELCLRHLALDLGQDEIAAEIKREHGTPMYEIVRYLDTHGIAARRVAATPDRIRSAIDLGLPVIVQEEYSTTSHVAVIVGYDEALGVFITADPNTHRRSTRAFEFTERAGDLFGNGGVIVLGRRGPALAELEAKADAAELLGQEHLELLDLCDEQLPRLGAGERADVALERVLQLADRALVLAPQFKLAWYRRWQTWARLAAIRPSAREELLDTMLSARQLFPDDEWPYQLHAQGLRMEGRYAEAYLVAFEAHRRDPDDANNLQTMGECAWLAGDLPTAERDLLAALVAEPFHSGAAVTLAAVYLRQLWALDEARGELAGIASVALARALELPPERPSPELKRSAVDLLRRARHFAQMAAAAEPDNPFAHELVGALAARVGAWEGARSSHARARELVPSRSRAIFGEAAALEQLGRVDDAAVLLADACQQLYGSIDPWEVRGEFLRRQRRAAEAAQVLQQGILVCEQGRERLVAPLFAALTELESAESAAAQLRELAEGLQGDDELLRSVAEHLDEERQRGHAIALLRHVVERSPADVGAVYRLGQLLGEDLLTRTEGRALLERARSLAPTSPLPRRQLAWLLVDEDPEQGLALLESVLAQEDPYVYDAQAALLLALGREAEAVVALERARAAFGDPARGLLYLCNAHLLADRYERALALAGPLFEALPALTDRELYEHAERCWLTSHRLSGGVNAILRLLQERCQGGVPAHLAHEVYWACRSVDQQLAERAARVQAGLAEDEGERLLWQIYAAAMQLKQGKATALAELEASAGENVDAWANIAWAYEAADRFADADRAAARAFALDPRSKDALLVAEERALRQGQVEEAFTHARALQQLYPYEHQGPERLALLHGKRLEVEPALELAARAVDAAPFCHVAQVCQAVALLVAGEEAASRRHAERALAIEPPEELDEPNDALLVVRALDGDVAGLERCLKRLEVKEPPTVFPDYRALLRRIAAASAGR